MCFSISTGCAPVEADYCKSVGKLGIFFCFPIFLWGFFLCSLPIKDNRRFWIAMFGLDPSSESQLQNGLKIWSDSPCELTETPFFFTKTGIFKCECVFLERSFHVVSVDAAQFCVILMNDC